MPQRPTAKKSVRQTKKRTLQNKSVKARLTTGIKKFERELERHELDAAQKQLDLVTKLLMKAASQGVIHRNKAARKQSQLQKSLSEAQTAASA